MSDVTVMTGRTMYAGIGLKTLVKLTLLNFVKFMLTLGCSEWCSTDPSVLSLRQQP